VNRRQSRTVLALSIGLMILAIILATAPQWLPKSQISETPNPLPITSSPPPTKITVTAIALPTATQEATVTIPPTETPIPIPTKVETLTPTITTLPTEAPPQEIDGFDVRSIDVQKLTQDMACRQEITPALIYQVTEMVADTNANYIAISPPLNDVTCGSTTVSNALERINNWVSAARQHDLHIWFRMKHTSAEGWYDTPKNTDAGFQIKVHVDFIRAHPELFQSGDIYTINPEPQNMGIAHINCNPNEKPCTFAGRDSAESVLLFNDWLISAYDEITNALSDAGVRGVTVGYFGYDGWIAFRDRNPGEEVLKAETIRATGNNVTFDHGYTEVDSTLNYDALLAHFNNETVLTEAIRRQVETGHPDPYVEYAKIRMYFDEIPDHLPVELCVGEWGAGANEFQDARYLRRVLDASAHYGIRCFNYYNLGNLPDPNGNQPREALVNFSADPSSLSGYSLTPTEYYQTVRNFYSSHAP